MSVYFVNVSSETDLITPIRWIRFFRPLYGVIFPYHKNPLALAFTKMSQKMKNILGKSNSNYEFEKHLVRYKILCLLSSGK